MVGGLLASYLPEVVSRQPQQNTRMTVYGSRRPMGKKVMMKSSDTQTTTKTGMNQDDLIPVSLLCGFLGAGKTTMMKGPE